MQPERLPSPSELKQRLELERAGRPFVEYQGSDGERRLVVLPAAGRASVGRDPRSDVLIEGDDEVSRLHAELVLIGGSWVVADDGLSRNGTEVGGQRVAGRRRLVDGDALRVGSTLILFRDPSAGEADRTLPAGDPVHRAEMTATQKRVLIALCRPYRDGSEFATPATNKEIAGTLFLSVEAVKTHLRSLFERFAVGDLPQNQKRVKLVENALRSGAVSPRDLRDQPPQGAG